MAAASEFIKFNEKDVERSVPDRFDQQADRSPHRIAVKTRTQQITYGAFNRSANQIAYAVNQQASRESPVALLLDHDLPAILSIFGVLKAGRNFVPLDPYLPYPRLKYMLEESGANLLVTNRERAGLAGNLFPHERIIDIDFLDASLGQENLDFAITPDQLSCILYTSGSTGEPKGVMHTHRNELHNVMHHTNSLSITSDDRLTLLGSYSTGQGLQDLYCALLNGATLYPWNLRFNGLSGLAAWLIEEQITVYHSAASVFRALIQTLAGKERFPALRVIRLGSEHVSWKDVEAYKRHFPDTCIFINALSSSETKTICQYVLRSNTQITARVPVGHAVVDTDILILDDSGNLLRPGEIGEIAVRSRFVSPGYWKKPDATRAAYISDPVDPACRLFRTGEWGRMSIDGCLEHLGRRDAQVKIRGYRVETYETELALLSHPRIDHVLVLCRENAKGDKYLAAYMTPSGTQIPAASELRSFLQMRIPDYMIPSVFLFMDSFQLTPNGKIDRSALPEPRNVRPALDTCFIPPTSLIEHRLADIWSDVLDIEEVGIHDNHFDLGGNSLTAMQIVARIERVFQVPLSLKEFFESPTIADVSRTVLMRFGATASRTDLRMGHIQRQQPIPLSFTQQRLWFLDQWEPASPVYNICRAYRIVGALDIEVMENSLSKIVQRHEILRTCFSAIGGQPTQIITSSLDLPMRLVDLLDIPQAERYERSLQVAAEDARGPFNLSTGPVLRTTLVRLADNEHLFVFTVHQIVCDGWSMQILQREFWATYTALVQHTIPPLPDLPLQYAEFALWQRRWVQDASLQSQIDYWKRQLDRSPPALNLPLDRAKRGQRSFLGAREGIVLFESLTEAIKELSREVGATLFMTSLAAFQALLYRYTQQSDFAIGFPIANRNFRETVGIVGSFVNVLVLRAELTAEPSFRRLIARVRDSCLGAYANQDVPFDKLIEELRPVRDASQNPIFQIMFVHRIPENSANESKDIVSEPKDIDPGTSKLDLTFSLAERRKQIAGFIEYSTDLFDRNTIQRMAQHYQTLLEAAVSNPDQSIATLPILTEAERHQILVEWNDTAADYPKDKCIHQLFEEQVERTPEAIAVDFEYQQITYQELNRRANQAAHYLISLGIGPEQLVGICVERSIEMVVGLLGILKAGGAYVPLDPGYPKERLRFMLDDAHIAVLLTQESLLDRIQNSTLSSRPLALCLDRDWPLIAQNADSNPKQAVNSTSLAYVVYTSGSTGEPKGVQIEHRSVVNCLHSLTDRLGFNERDVLLAVTTIAFDISVLELFLPLFIGGKVVVASRDRAADGTALIDTLANSPIAALQATPSTWRLLLEAGWEGSPGFKILCGGEALSRDLAEALLTRGEVWNLYGPTESTIWSTVEKVEHGEGPVLIGRPLANTKIYILDSHLQPVPIGVHGDLYIGGDRLARGYWNNPELTAARFVSDPFSDDVDARLYRTGDRARYRPDGKIEFLGRTDNQVKIRGHRIDLGEIESALMQHPAVKEAVVVPRERDSSGEKELLTYVVTRDESRQSVSELRQFLQGKLPDYMIPSWFLFLDVLPLTSNGKLDRNALPPSDGERPALDQGFVEPRTQIEELITQVWRKVLRCDTIGVHDNFFDLGGHSLLAVRVVYRLRDALQVQLTLRDFFEVPTVAELAMRIGKFKDTSRSLPPIRAVERTKPIPPSIAQEHILTLAGSFPDLCQFNIPAAYRLLGPLNLRLLEQSLVRVIERHEALRTVFPLENGTRCQSIVDSPAIALNVVPLHEWREAERESRARKFAMEDFRRPFDLTGGPLFRVTVIRMSGIDHLLVLTLHHIISDGWSMGLFFRDLAEFYNAALHGHPPHLPDLPIQYVDFTIWQRNVLNKGLLDTQLLYWKTQLSEPLAPLEFPGDLDRNDIMGFFTARKDIAISNEVFQPFKSSVRKLRSTPFVVLSAALNVLLYRYLGQDDIRLATLAANRDRNEVENTIGHFANTLILRTRISRDMTFKELVLRLGNTSASAHSNQDLPFEILLQGLDNDAGSGRNALSPLLFVFQRQLHTINLATLRVGILDSLNSGAPEIILTEFDIVILLRDSSEGLTGFCIYKMFVFDEMTVARFLQNFNTLIEQIASDPNQSVSALCSCIEI